MRTIFMLPLTALVAVVAGCGSEARESAARSVPERDLTLVTQTPQVEVASPVEIERPQVQHRTVGPSRLAPASRSRREPKVKVADVWVPAPVLATPQPVAQPASMAPAPEPNNDRELLPGKTVTLIPASSGPSTGPDQTDGLPEVRGRTVVARGGGTCRGRGRGPGVGAAPRPDFR
jgi:hypothetical protein